MPARRCSQRKPRRKSQGSSRSLPRRDRAQRLGRSGSLSESSCYLALFTCSTIGGGGVRVICVGVNAFGNITFGGWTAKSLSLFFPLLYESRKKPWGKRKSPLSSATGPMELGHWRPTNYGERGART